MPVTTRSKAAKIKAYQSPEPSAQKVTKLRKQTATAADPLGEAASTSPSTSPAQHQRLQQLIAKQPLASGKAMGAQPSKGGSGWPASHPLASLPGSPHSGGPAGEFTIAAVQQPQAMVEALEQAAAATRPSENSPSPPLAEQQQQAEAAPAVSVEPVAAAAQHEDPVHVQQPGPSTQQQQQQQQAAMQPLAAAPQPRPEKLLKPLPEHAVPCDKLPDGPEPVQVDVEYFARADLQPVEDTAAAIAAAVPGLEASDWLETVKALNLLRQLVVHHPDTCSSQLDRLVPLVLKSVRSLRSSVCKTAIMATCDLYQSFGDALLPHTDTGGLLKPTTSMLAQILLKCSSNDKKFVIEEAQRALQTMIDSLTPAESLRLLLPYADQHKNPKVRGKTGCAVAEAVARMQPSDMLAFGMPRLLQVVGKLVTDNTPDARESAKKVIGLLKAAAADPTVEAALAASSPRAPPAPAAEGEEPSKQPTVWEAFCQANLSGSAALAVLKASNE